MANRSSSPDRLSLPEPFPVPPAWQGVAGAALFSPCGRYRWWLLRHCQPGGPPIVFVGLNPSVADGSRGDPTLGRLCALARHWGHGPLLVLNLFSRVGRQPAQLRRSAEPEGAHTDAWLVTALEWLQGQPPAPLGPPPRVWLGWGNRGDLHGRHGQVLHLLRCWRGEVVCVGLTRRGQPRHPLFSRASEPPLPFAMPPEPCPVSPVATPFTCS